MANLTIKGIPDELYEQIKKSASRSRRSIAAEATVLLERALGRRPISEQELSRRAAALRSQTNVWMELEDLEAAINEGRE